MAKRDKIGELIARKQKAARIEIPKPVQLALERIFENNDQYPKNSHLRISADEAVDVLGELGFTTNRNMLRRIAKQLGRRGYAEK